MAIKKKRASNWRRIAELEFENDRLYSHHSACKDRIADTIEIAQKWRIKAFVCEKMLGYLNELNPFWDPEDMKKEIEIHTNRLVVRWKKGERWWEDEPIKEPARCQ